MKRSHLNSGLVLLALVLAACNVATNGPQAEVPAPAPAGGVCRATDTTPAVIESISEQVLVEPATVNPDGTIASPARYRSVTRQVITRERREITFLTPCPEIMDTAFIASLQRALKARGFYSGPTTGRLDEATRRAIRSFQKLDGLDSAILSLDSARRLGLVVAAFADEDTGK
jgi:hypothetical protein